MVTGYLSALGGLVFLLLALPAAARSLAHAERRRLGRLLFELGRCLVAVAAAVALFLLAWGQPA